MEYMKMKAKQANMQSDAIEMSKMIPLEKDYKYQMGLMKKQLQMIYLMF